MKIHNRFDVIVEDVETGKVRLHGVGYNTVLDSFGFSFSPDSIAFGSGSRDVSIMPNRNSLVQRIGRMPISKVERSWEGNTLKTTYQAQPIEASQFVNSSITEIGLFNDRNYTTFTHSFINDSEGNPLTILKTNKDIITFYATVFITIEDDWRVKHTGNDCAIFDFSRYYVPYSSGYLSMDSFTPSGVKQGDRDIVYSFDLSNTQLNGLAIRVFYNSNQFVTIPNTGYQGSYVKKEKLEGADGSKTLFNLKWSDGQNLSLFKNNVMLEKDVDYSIISLVKVNDNVFCHAQSIETDAIFDGFYQGVVEDNQFIKTIPRKDVFDAVLKSEKYMYLHRGIGFVARNLSYYIVNLRDFVDVDFCQVRYYANKKNVLYKRYRILGYDGSKWVSILESNLQDIKDIKQAVSKVRINKVKVELLEPIDSSFPYKVIPWVFLYRTSGDMIKLSVPPTVDDVVEADYFVNYIPKDENHIVRITKSTSLRPVGE